MPAAILDPFGFPAHSGSGGRVLEASRNDSKKGPPVVVVTESISKSVSYWDWRVVLAMSRKLWANFGPIKGATASKAMHSIGRAWEPEFLGEDKEWGKIATEWLQGWYRLCDVRGGIYDFKTNLYLASISIDRDGDFGVLLTQTEDGYPQLQHIPADRIGMRYGSVGIVGNDVTTEISQPDGTTKPQKGVYAGLRIQHGVIYNSRGRPVAVRILGSTPEDDRDVSTRDFIMRFDPEYYDQSRGFSAFSGSLDFIRGAMASHEWEQQALLIAGTIGLIEHTESGALDPNDGAVTIGSAATATSAATLTTQTLEGGMIRAFRAGSGSKLEQFKNERPGEAWDSFNDRIIRIALNEMNWPYSLTWKPDGMNGTQERSAIEQARSSIADRQDLLRPLAEQEVGYAISKAINLGQLPPYKGRDIGGFLKWGFSVPPQFNIDHGREDQQWREGYKLGLVNVGDYLRRDGQKADVKAHWKDRAYEEADKLAAIAEVESERGVKIDPRTIQMFTPNDQPQGTEPTNQPTK